MGPRVYALCGLSVALPACNQLLGLDKTTPLVFDAPIDAPFQCPPIGMQPAFGKELHQVITRDCFFFSMSYDRGLAAASCHPPAVADDIPVTGPPEALEDAILSGDPTASSYGMVRLTPEGDELWVHRGTASTAFISVYRRLDDRHWTYVRDLATPTPARDDRFSTPTACVDGVRHFLHFSFAATELREYRDDGSTTTLVHAYSLTDLAALYMLNPNVTANGLRLVFAGEPLTGSTGPATLYADRASIDALFSPAVPMTTAPVATDPFLTDDCGRLYTWGLGSIFYAQQL